MIYIDGLGYIDETAYNPVTSVKQNNPVNFDNILATETALLNSKDKKTLSLDEIFKEAATKYNVSESMLKAIAYHESRYQTDATSYAGAQGIMQLMPSTAKALGVDNAYDPYQSIMGAAKLLKQLSNMYDGNESLMLAAYNAGSGNVEKYGGIPPFKETQNYVAKVLNTMKSGATITNNSSYVINDDGTSSAANAPYSASGSQPTVGNILSGITGSDLTEATDSFYRDSNLDDIFSYSDYELLMTYFQNMLEIISSIGETDSDSNDTSDDSLADLFRLGGSNILYNHSTINL